MTRYYRTTLVIESCLRSPAFLLNCLLISLFSHSVLIEHSQAENYSKSIWAFENQGLVRRPMILEFRDEPPQYEIYISYPEFNSETIAEAQQLNKLSSEIARREANRFKDDVRNLSHSGRKHTKLRSFIENEIEIGMIEKNIVSYRFVFTKYIESAAHPQRWTTVVNYRLNPLREITLNELLVDANLSMETLSKQSMKYLQGKLELSPDQRQLIVGGTDAKAEHFQKFILFPKHISFFFDESQVVPDSNAELRVDIPMDGESKK